MARHEDVVNTIWDDLDHLSNNAFMLYVWSFTNTKCGMAGLYPVTRRTLLEGRLSGDDLDAALAELDADDKLFYVDGVLWNKARVSHLAGFKKGKLSDFIARAIIKDLKAVSSSNPLVARFIERYSGHPSLEGLRTVLGPSGEGLDSVLQSGAAEGLQTLQGQRQGQGQGEPSEYSPVLAKLDQVAFARGAKGPKVDAAIGACEQFSHLDLSAEAERFAHYWIDGPGEKRGLADVSWAWRGWLERVRPGESKSGGSASSSDDFSDYDAVMEPAA
ncbi:MAG TPA: hypothetical protein VI039_13060 [Solirubrobacterales bacterium]